MHSAGPLHSSIIVNILDKMPTAVAKVNGVVLAETDTWETVEGNVYVSWRHLEATRG